MITIKIKNSEQLVSRRKGWLISKAVSLTGQSDRRVDQLIAEKIKEVLESQGVDAEVSVVQEA